MSYFIYRGGLDPLGALCYRGIWAPLACNELKSMASEASLKIFFALFSRNRAIPAKWVPFENEKSEKSTLYFPKHF